MQGHQHEYTHAINTSYLTARGSDYGVAQTGVGAITSAVFYCRYGDTTRGKRKGVKYIIKVL